MDPTTSLMRTLTLVDNTPLTSKPSSIYIIGRDGDIDLPTQNNPTLTAMVTIKEGYYTVFNGLPASKTNVAVNGNEIVIDTPIAIHSDSNVTIGTTRLDLTDIFSANSHVFSIGSSPTCDIVLNHEQCPDSVAAVITKDYFGRSYIQNGGKPNSYSQYLNSNTNVWVSIPNQGIDLPGGTYLKFADGLGVLLPTQNDIATTRSFKTLSLPVPTVLAESLPEFNPAEIASLLIGLQNYPTNKPLTHIYNGKIPKVVNGILYFDNLPDGLEYAILTYGSSKFFVVSNNNQNVIIKNPFEI